MVKSTPNDGRAASTEGRNIRIDTRWGAGDAARFHKYAEELLALQS
jgi:hypothetical protein